MNNDELIPLTESMQQELLKELEITFPMDGIYTSEEFNQLSDSMEKFILDWRNKHGV